MLIVVVVIVAVLLLKGFDQIAGRGPKQVSDGIKKTGVAPKDTRQRIPCPNCAEMILPEAKICPFCKSSLID